jgi:hypothetical protein
MSWLTVNGIELAGIVSLGDASGERRDIGASDVASDGSMRITRQTRKRDHKFTTKLLTGADAFAWENLLVGEGHVWSFDSSFYSSKGMPGIGSSAPPDVEVQSSVKKYGAGALKVVGGESWATSGIAVTAPWTVSVWHRVDAGGFVHVVRRSDGAVWHDAVRDDTPVDGDPAEGAGEIQLANSAGSAHYYDDLVVCPYLWLDSWARDVANAGYAFGLTPFLTCAGNLVREVATRRMLCSSLSEKMAIAGLGGSLQRDARTLSFELKGA